MSYTNTFVKVSADCPVTQSEVPVPRGDKKPMHVIQYELLVERPYHYNHEELIFEVYVRHKAIPPEKAAAHRRELWAELFQKGHPCMRASALTKRYGWGAHYDQHGKIAIYPMESVAYQQFVQAPEGIKLLGAMRNKRA
jgi:hypothetical protein